MKTFDELEDFTVAGPSLQTFMDGFGGFALIASQILLEENLGRESGDGLVKFDPHEWVPLKNLMRALDRIGKEYGSPILRQVGSSVPNYIDLPPHVTNIDIALQSVNVAYHMNHALKGQPMFSPETGEMLEGIGHYRIERTKGRNQSICKVDSAYPCPMDEGLMESMARRFERTANIKHEPGSCRDKGGPHCTYTIEW